MWQGLTILGFAFVRHSMGLLFTQTFRIPLINIILLKGYSLWNQIYIKSTENYFQLRLVSKQKQVSFYPPYQFLFRHQYSLPCVSVAYALPSWFTVSIVCFDSLIFDMRMYISNSDWIPKQQQCVLVFQNQMFVLDIVRHHHKWQCKAILS